MSYYEDDDDYSVNPPFLGQTARRALIGAAVVFMLLWLMWSPTEGYKPCLGDCPDIPKKPPVVVNPYIWPYSGASCLEDLYVVDKNVRGTSEYQPLVSLNTPDHVVMSSVSFVV